MRCWRPVLVATAAIPLLAISLLLALLQLSGPPIAFLEQQLITPPAPAGPAAEALPARLRPPVTARDVPDLREESCLEATEPLRLSVAVIMVTSPGEEAGPVSRAVRAVLARSPEALLMELWLVQDRTEDGAIEVLSNNATLQQELEALAGGGVVRVLTASEPLGILGCRMLAARAASAQVLTFVDSYTEVQPGWLEAMVAPLHADHTTVAFPRLDWEDAGTWATHRGGIGCRLGLLFSPLSEHEVPVPPHAHDLAHHTVASPVMFGSVFSIQRQFFFDLGGFDPEYGFGGGDNLELAFRVWMCGRGRVVCASCSRVYQVFYKGIPGRIKKGFSWHRNPLRTAALYLGSLATLPELGTGMSRTELLQVRGDVGTRAALPSGLSCQSFEWFLREVYPEALLQSMEDVAHVGLLRLEGSPVLCLDTAQNANQKQRAAFKVCHGGQSQRFAFLKRGWIMPLQKMELCLASSGQWLSCGGFHLPKDIAWQAELDGRLQEQSTQLCLGAADTNAIGVPCSLAGQAHPRWTLDPL